jgi:esterase/lipase superfamily enzyme
MNHWIITNREIGTRTVGGKKVEFIADTRREPMPTFRIATFKPYAPGTIPKKDDALLAKIDSAVSLIPDEPVDGYADLEPDDNPTSVNASRRLLLSLYQTMTQAPEGKGDTLFFIHGFNYAWPDAVRHLQRLHELYVLPSESPIDRIVYFTWPSWGQTGRYPSDQEIAWPSGLLLGRVFAKTVRFYADFFRPSKGKRPFCGRKIHLAAHSMGNQVLREFIRQVAPVRHLHVAIFGEVLMLNADLEWHALEGGQPLFDLHQFCDRTHVYNHHHDDALHISEATKNSEKRLGRHGPRSIAPGVLPPRTVVVDCSALGAPDDATPDTDAFINAARRVLGTSKVDLKERLGDHWGYLYRPEVIADLYGVLKGHSSGALPRRTAKAPGLYALGSAE